ncbi:hypothetical protein AYW79_10250 [Ferroacidibacillus organovorans]|uniref:HTH lysR-type domain-containing protein n=2 Tax=Ferroacidibacillus organovorans TaxID=1765683 RepID=A0A853KBJ6_9BACL|nr:hypothetical protein AYJ22_10480 [Ferroacidibacillus organovorans]OAG93499.1 hypothetical protein AYW79_10250 [Ferroacidibacillus organovorans]
MRMEFRHLEYFIAVAEELNFGRAAQRLQMTQPPLSQQIQQLERELGTALFIRTQRRVELSPAGRAFLPEARSLLKHAERAKRLANDVGAGRVGRIAVGFVGSATYDILPLTIREYRAAYPEVYVHLRELPTPSQVESLLKGEIDVGFIRPPIASHDLRVETLYRDRAVLAVPKMHPSSHRAVMRLSDLGGESWVLLARSTWSGFYDEILAKCSDAGFDPNIELTAAEFQTVLGVVAAGLGISIVPSSAAIFKREDVVFIPLEGEVPTIEMSIAWRAADDSAQIRQFLDVTRKMARNQQGG